VVQGEDKGVCFSLLGDLVFVGREGCQITLSDNNVSKKHAELNWQNDTYSIRDLGSSNGILHNGQKVANAVLQPGDLVMVGLTVFEVYPAGQTRKNERGKQLIQGSRQTVAAALKPALVQQTEGAESATQGDRKKADPEQEKKQRENSKRRLIIGAGIFFLVFTLYFSEENRSIKEKAKIEQSEQEQKPTKRRKDPKLARKEVEEALAPAAKVNEADIQQRKDAEIFFRSGVRELQNKNFRRAFASFDTALTVDPSHDLAKIYMRTAKKEMLGDLKATNGAALRAMKSLRYNEARMHYANIIRYLEGEQGGTGYMENEANKDIKKLYEDAKKALKEIDEKEKTF
jgi:pSer/pThr/pTyr-binding forkhead associated (FHA) protein